MGDDGAFDGADLRKTLGGAVSEDQRATSQSRTDSVGRHGPSARNRRDHSRSSQTRGRRTRQDGRKRNRRPAWLSAVEPPVQSSRRGEENRREKTANRAIRR